MSRLDHFEISVKYMLPVPVYASSLSTGLLRVTILVSHRTHFTVLTFFKHPNETLVASLAWTWSFMASDTKRDDVKCNCEGGPLNPAGIILGVRMCLWRERASLTYIRFKCGDVKHACKRHFISPAGTYMATRTFIKSYSLCFSSVFGPQLYLLGEITASLAGPFRSQANFLSAVLRRSR